MRKILLIAIVFISSLAKAQTTKPIDGFLGIKFGASQAQVIEALRIKGGTQYSGQTPHSISFGSLTLGTRKVSTLFVHFVNDQAYEAIFVFRPIAEPQTIEYYNALKKDISEVYGNGQEKKIFKSPYTDGDGYEITALKSGNAHYITSWPNGDKSITEDIFVNSAGDLSVRLYYNDDKLGAIYEEQQKAQNKSDL